MPAFLSPRPPAGEAGAAAVDGSSGRVSALKLIQFRAVVKRTQIGVGGSPVLAVALLERLGQEVERLVLLRPACRALQLLRRQRQDARGGVQGAAGVIEPQAVVDLL